MTSPSTIPSTAESAPEATRPPPGAGTQVPPPQVWPTLRARDARALIDFLAGAFGFEEVAAYPDGQGGIAHAQLAWPAGGGVMLGSVRDDPDDVWAVPPGSFGCYVVTADPDAVHARAVAAGARIARALAGTDYGSREFIALDPEGNRWSFGTYQGEPRPAPRPA
jgi:uncharacterized glyoxalase superfamily protein PhnB